MVNISVPQSKGDTLAKIFLFILTLSVMFGMFLVYDYLDDWRSEQLIDNPGFTPGTVPEGALISCTDLGCPQGTAYTGSSNSNLYHGCNCFYAKTILPGNRVCFNSQEEAISQGKKAGNCL